MENCPILLWIFLGSFVLLIPHCSAVWNDYTIVPSQSYSPSLAIVEGNPALSFIDSNGNLFYVRANDAEGTSWGTPVQIGLTAYFTSLAVINGNPAIAIATSTVFGFIRATDILGANWGAFVLLDTVTASNSWIVSLITVNGNPAIATTVSSTGSGQGQYIRAEDADGVSWGTPVSFAQTNMAWIILLIVNGNPAIFFLPNMQSVGYMRSTDQNGGTWGPSQTILTTDINGFAISHPSATIIEGKPAVVIAQPLLGDSVAYLSYLVAEDLTGTEWGTAQTVNLSGVFGQRSSLSIQIVNSLPSVVFCVPWVGFIQSFDSSGSIWGTPIILDNSSTTGVCQLIATSAGDPGVVSAASALPASTLKFFVDQSPPTTSQVIATTTISLVTSTAATNPITSTAVTNPTTTNPTTINPTTTNPTNPTAITNPTTTTTATTPTSASSVLSITLYMFFLYLFTISG